MSPNSGARSGTKPSRRERGAGDGRLLAPVKLACGHEGPAEPVAVFPGGRRMYACPKGCGLQKGTR